ncbi:MAG: hypothetical protein BWX71_01362 [Deltaproteobacteria bacterium ADurb.Bin072]|nr:MAG: hypothetical protein BWX71_01362 [Deltaproteobacteria bacterium ADurb.Bin072]
MSMDSESSCSPSLAVTRLSCTALLSSPAPKGLVRKFLAPRRIASTARGMVPYPVMIMIFAEMVCSFFSILRISRPSILGSLTSSRMRSKRLV